MGNSKAATLYNLIINANFIKKKQQSGERNTTITQHGFSQETLQEFLYGKKKTTIVDIYVMERKRKLADVKNDIPDKLKYSGMFFLFTSTETEQQLFYYILIVK